MIMDTVFLLATIFFGVVVLKDVLTILFLLIIGSRLEQDEAEKREGKYLLRALLCTYLFVGYEWLILVGNYRKKVMMWSLFISSLVLWVRDDQRFLAGVVLLGWYLLYRFLIPIVPRLINPDWQAYTFLLVHRICFFSVLIILLGIFGVSVVIGGTILLLLLLLHSLLDSWLWKSRENL